MLNSPYRRLLAGAWLLRSGPAAGAPGGDGHASIAVKRSSAPIILDGRLDEPAWREAPVAKLVQQSPRPGEPTPYETEVRVIMAGDRLYFGFLCRDPEPKRASVHTMRRDDPMTGDDMVGIALDRYGDKKTGYWFRVNAAGARADGLIAGPEHPSFDWDGVWDARTARFPLFFPEKRVFFVEGANQYEFALGLGSQFIPFFSRRIGLLEGQPIPIQGGLKLNGRVGRGNLAMLDVQTRQTAVKNQVVPGVNLFAGCFSYDLTDKLRVGTILTNGDPEGHGRNSLMGFDAVWRTSKFRGNKNLLAGGWTALTSTDRAPEGRRSGWGFKFDYPNDLWDCSIAVNDFGMALNPALGFLPRRGVRRTDLRCTLQPRPSKNGPFRAVRQQFFENEFNLVRNHQGIAESWGYFMAPLNFRLESGDRAEFNWYPHYEFLAAPFEIACGVVIPPGSYRFTRWRIEAQTSTHRRFQAGSTTWFGSFYSGNLTQWENYVRWTSPEGRLQLGLTTENNYGHLQTGSFVQRLWQLQTAFAWNPNLVLTSFIQYDTESRNLGSNTRLRWTIRPGNDLFIVWNRGWQRLILNPRELRLIPDNELLAVKLRWTFRR